MILTYEKIRELKQLEKQDKLQDLPENFSIAVAEYINLKKGSDEEVSAKSLIKSLYDLRKKKIINLAGLFYKTDKIPENIEGMEEELYLNTVEIMRKYNISFEGLFNKQSETERTESKNNKQYSQSTKTKNMFNSLQIKEDTANKPYDNNSQENKLKVVFLSDIPEIITPTGEICSFKKEEEKELNTEFAIQLKEQGFCRFK
ncbi:MAG: hypothetical protein KAT28_03930 [Candidatus Aenigmarchaeota archaeon]|nr:hypothetical protein [Candidatus Aenigmarchaeota archaeon]